MVCLATDYACLASMVDSSPLWLETVLLVWAVVAYYGVMVICLSKS